MIDRKPLVLDNTALAAIQNVTPSQWCQAYYLFAAGAVVAVAAMPREVRRLLVDYGARKSKPTEVSQSSHSQSRSESEGKGKHDNDTSGEAKAKGKVDRNGGGNWLLSLINTLTSYGQVPHSWFITFYVASVACSLLWLWQFAVDGGLLRVVASSQFTQAQASPAEGGGGAASDSSVTAGQVGLAWTMMFLQGSRRLYEDSLVHGKSKSTMWIVHWVLGLSYYLVTGVAVWVEGSGATNYGMPLFKTLVAIAMFLYASVNQYSCHIHLAGLKKYSLPELGLFRYLICPHYFCECLVYLSLAIVAAPKGELLNKTLLCALAFVVVNLGVTASGTRKWATVKHGTELAPQLGNFQDITIREADPNSSLVVPILVQRWLAQETPVCNGLLRHVHIGRKRVNAVKTHGADHGVVCRPVLVRHDARVGRIFVNKDMVGSAVGAIRKDVLLLLLFVTVAAIG
ncbi:hypothetical protein QBC32DRAFT_369310 [Pseudoneurospora amorphoporcata]|uniref:Polyprenal reductase n=1 Tax=Pseudoneurospora amorphoporcata TaxID=241081 RepID=A0AAN6P0J8_9PEZI|nr:hypothetical protein QBC32DRAFT_369310 [Pseudoneurospora amorphoporcata]